LNPAGITTIILHQIKFNMTRLCEYCDKPLQWVFGTLYKCVNTKCTQGPALQEKRDIPTQTNPVITETEITFTCAKVPKCTSQCTLCMGFGSILKNY